MKEVYQTIKNHRGKEERWHFSDFFLDYVLTPKLEDFLTILTRHPSKQQTIKLLLDALSRYIQRYRSNSD